MPETKDAVVYSRATVVISWDDIPWLDESTKAEILAGTPPHLRATVSRGIPTVGSGAIYPIPVDDVLYDSFPIPDHYKKMYGMDVGFNYTAAVFGALDPDTDCLYIYGEHIAEKQIPEIHAAAIKRVAGDWMPGVIDPSSTQGSHFDGDKLIREYRSLGLRVRPADNAIGEGIHKVWRRLETGSLKFARGNATARLQSEYLMYRRDDNGKIVKEHDHLMDALRYMCNTLHFASVQPAKNRIMPTARRLYNV